MMRKRAEEPQCSNGIRCVAYPALGEPSKLSRGNPGTRCFACEDRRVTSELKTARVNKKAVERRKARRSHWSKGKDNLAPQDEEIRVRLVQVVAKRWELRLLHPLLLATSK